MSVTPFAANFNAQNDSEFDQGFTANSVSPVGTGSYETDDPFEGAAYAKVTIPSGNNTRFGRWVENAPALVEGDEFWLGFAWRVEAGFAASSRSSSTRLLVFDNVQGDGDTDRVGLWISSANTLQVHRHKETVVDTSILNMGQIGDEYPEDTWMYVEAHWILNDTNGSAFTEVFIDNVSQGSTTTANVHTTAEFPFSRFRVGVTDQSGTTDTTYSMHFDDIYVDTTQRGPTEGPPDIIGKSLLSLGVPL